MGMFDFMKVEAETDLKERSERHRANVIGRTPYVPTTAQRIEAENKNMAELRVRGEQASKVEPVPEKAYIPIKYDPVSVSIKSYTPEQIAEYAEIAEAVGVAPDDLKVEEFKTYLRGKDFPVYNLDTVVAFMDAKSKAEGQGWGWSWVPLRYKDRISASFGRAATRREINRWARMNGETQWEGQDSPASDHYTSHNWAGGMGQAIPVSSYDKVVPLHALKKVAMIEREFKHSVSFMVSDYAPAPAFKADPFLMAVINNSNLRSGAGRFVIDVWDEPGFGINEMLQSAL